jgi:hypothetical protein
VIIDEPKSIVTTVKEIVFAPSMGFLLGKAWVRIASSALSANAQFTFNKPLAESALEAMRTQRRLSFCFIFKAISSD